MSPVPEPASAALRRLIEDMSQFHSPSLSNVAVLSTIAALPALADLVKTMESIAQLPCRRIPDAAGLANSCASCSARLTLAALRERLGAKP